MKLEKIIKYHKNGNIDREYYINPETGLKEGLYKSYYNNGNLYCECFYKNVKREGEYKLYWDNGNIYIECTYKSSYRDGLFKSYYYDGKLDSILYYSNGKMITKKEYYNRNNNKINVSYLGLMI